MTVTGKQWILKTQKESDGSVILELFARFTKFGVFAVFGLFLLCASALALGVQLLR